MNINAHADPNPDRHPVLTLTPISLSVWVSPQGRWRTGWKFVTKPNASPFIPSCLTQPEPDEHFFCAPVRVRVSLCPGPRPGLPLPWSRSPSASVPVRVSLCLGPRLSLSLAQSGFPSVPVSPGHPRSPPRFPPRSPSWLCSSELQSGWSIVTPDYHWYNSLLA